MRIRQEEIRKQVYACINCNSCTGRYPDESCPFRLVQRGTVHGLRGFLHVLKGVIEGRIPLSEELAAYAYMDTFCGACEARCIYGIDVAEIGRAFRMDLVEAGLGPRPEHVSLIQGMKNYDNPWGLPRRRRKAWARGLRVPETSPEGGPRIEVLYYVGCTASSDPLATTMAKRTVSILNKASVDFAVLGSREKCCASTTYWLGEHGVFEQWAGKNREILNTVRAEIIVTSCAGCYLMLEKVYPRTVGPLNKEVLHTTAYVERLLGEGRIDFTKRLDTRATYHDPCHLGRHGGVFDAPRRILEAIPGLHFVEMFRSGRHAWCCGAGGGVRSAYPENAFRIAGERLEEAEATGAETLVSACPFCYQNLSLAIQRRASPLRFADITELIDEAIEDPEGPLTSPSPTSQGRRR